MKTLARLAAAAVLAALPLPATSAEGPDLAAGYSFLDLDEQARHGVAAALSFRAAGRVRVWIDASAQAATVGGVDLTTTTLMAGPGLSFGHGRARPFVRAMAGLVRDEVSLTIFEAEISESDSVLGVLAGAGVDVRLSKRLALRVQGDYLWRDVETGDASGLRAGAGLVWRFGTRE